MTRDQIAALGYPEGEVLDAAETVAKSMVRRGYPHRSVSVAAVDDSVITDLLLDIKRVPLAYSHVGYTKPVRALAHAWYHHKLAQQEKAAPV